MAVTALDGHGNLMRRVWEGERDDDGHRTWTVKHQVSSTSKLDGPSTVMACSNLPQIGDLWNFGNDNDTWAFCWPTMNVKYLSGPVEGEPSYYWEVTQKFSTKPMHRCNTTQIANPISEPFLISGSFVKYTKEVQYDHFGHSIRSSSHEQVHGPGVEFDFNRLSVKIGWNVASMNILNVASFVDTVNDSTLWNMPARCVKLSNYSFERVLYGVCTFYYKQNLEFDIDFNTFDRQLLDEGYNCLNGEWAKGPTDPGLTTYRNGSPLPAGSLWKLLPMNPAEIAAGGSPVYPDRSNPQHFTRYKDRNGEMARCILDGNGEPANLGEVPILWTTLTAYRLGTIVLNPTTSGTSLFVGGNVYECIKAGTSGTSSGPAGTGSSIPDGSCTWKFLYAYTTVGSTPGNIDASYYPQSNMLLLGIPSSL